MSNGSTVIREHVFLPHCWVCNEKFGPSVKEERHHLIPQAYGGTDGPQVSLCDSHHSALHFIALRLYRKSPFKDLLTHKPDQDQKLVYLATVVCNARLLTENDPNKKRVEVVTFDGETFEKLKKLKTVVKGSRENIIRLAVRQLYARHFKE